MNVIKTKADLKKLREKGTLPECYQSYLEAEFSELARCLGNGVEENTFDLSEHGPMVLVEASDDLRGSLVGLNPQDGGLLGASLEYVETYNIKPVACQKEKSEFILLKAFVLSTNDFGALYYLPLGVHPDKEAEAWLKDQSECVYRFDPNDRNEKKRLPVVVPW